MKTIEPSFFNKGTAQHQAVQLLQFMLEADDGTVGIVLDDTFIAGMQVTTNPQETEEYGDEYAFYDFLLNQDDTTIEIDEDTTGTYSLEQIEMLIENRITKIIQSLD